MRKIILIIFAVLVCILSLHARENKDRIYIQVLQPERENIPQEAAKQLENKLNQLITSNGIASDDPSCRFVLTSKASITDKDVIAGAPTRVSMKIDFTFIVGDAEENKVFESKTISSVGIGVNENKAMIMALKNIKPHSPELVDFIKHAKEKILSYYSQRCGEIKNQAQKLAANRDYDGAIYQLMQIPEICECSDECQTMAISYYKQRTEENAAQALTEAKAAWASSPNADGASRVADILASIPAGTKVNKGVETLISEINRKVKADERREWNFKIRQYHDRIAAERREQQMRAEQNRSNNEARLRSIEASRQVGLEYARHQPKTIVYNRNVILW